VRAQVEQFLAEELTVSAGIALETIADDADHAKQDVPATENNI